MRTQRQALKTQGYRHTEEGVYFCIWAPGIKQVTLAIYDEALDTRKQCYQMIADEERYFEIHVKQNLIGKYYTYILDEQFEITDPYSVALSTNSIKSAIIDKEKTNPIGWENHAIPSLLQPTDAIIYELHIKDFTYHMNTGVKYRGKFLGLSQEGSSYQGVSTGLDHLKELGVTHIHLLPIYDFITVDEEPHKFDEKTNYNWGYDPEHYNTPEGSYATKLEDPHQRILELKQMIMKLHESGFKVVLDVVYNHTFRGKDSHFNLLAPNEYYRTVEDGSFSNGSGCGNEMASERPVVRKMIIDSLLYWAKEFKVDGFRFDLMALIDKQTIHEAILALKAIKDDFLIYGEPWAAATPNLPTSEIITKGSQKGAGFALFNDEIRDAIKGDNNGMVRGFSQGNGLSKEALKRGIVGSIAYNETYIGFAIEPSETINYINAHDDLILADKMKKIFPDASEEELIKYNQFALSILFTSQGIPFLHEGNEFLRDKKGISNTYNAPMDVNAVDWDFKKRYQDFFRYCKELIELRKTHSEFRLSSAQAIKKRLKFFSDNDEGTQTILYTIELEKTNNVYTLVALHAGQEYFSLQQEQIKKHLEEQYGDKEQAVIVKIFDENGWVRQQQAMPQDQVIQIPPHTMHVYQIKNHLA